jgi:hypothetical protein
MARVNKDKTPRLGDEQEEMTVVILRFKGGGETLRKGFDTVSQALNALVPTSAPRLPVTRIEEPVAASYDSGTDSGRVDLEAEAESDDNNNGSDPTRERSARKHSSPRFLSDFNLSPEGQMAWKEYATDKNPQTLSVKYLVAGAWLTLHGGQQVFTARHVFTCFRAMGWEEQRDFSQPMRHMKASKSYFDVPKRGQWKMGSLGMDAVNSPSAKEPE